MGSRVDYGGKRVVALDVLCCVFGCFPVRVARSRQEQNGDKFRPAFLVHDSNTGNGRESTIDNHRNLSLDMNVYMLNATSIGA